MTKEEIIKSHTGLWSVTMPKYLHDSYSEAMDEYAKQEAIGFAEWLDINCVNYQFGSFKYNGKSYTPREIYPIYKNKDNE